MITFERVFQDDEIKKQKLLVFADDFKNYPGHEQHTITNWTYPVYVVKDGEEWIGYTQIVTCPIVFSAWHPKHEQPHNIRRIREAMLQLKGWCRFQYGTGLCAVKTGIHTFTHAVMEKLDFKRLGLELYEPKE